ncbi:MAG TPA: SMP-30/gluconolactonase/LRE family protein [Candidatus Dormibacteraeota bacterium]|nr:SMP-30/gluconolactonase/LRE family protein [Candidatus Dormibacteraeota bacterium]
MQLRDVLPLCLFLWAATCPGADDYKPGPDSLPQPAVPKGEVTKHSFDTSKIFPGTIHEYWVYVPANHDNSKPAPFIILQDGIQYLATNVLDNLISKKQIPPMIGIFVLPGRVPALSTNALDRYNRSYEYDGLGDNYARFLLEELLPYLAREQKLYLSADPNDHAIAGASSGAICAFTAAWERPGSFRRVFSSVGTFVGLRGGNEYPTLIRKTEPKPIRVFLQDGTNDLNIYGGNWFLANQEMLSALEFAGYDVAHDWGEGGHNGKHATAIFPDAMRWLWRDYPAPIRANPETKSKQPLMDEILIPAEEWQVASKNHHFTEGPASNSKGELFFTDLQTQHIFKIGTDSNVTIFVEQSGGANGLMFGPDGRLYACQNRKKQIVAFNSEGKEETIVDQVDSNDLAIGYNGNIYFTDPVTSHVWLINSKREKLAADTGIPYPNGIVFSPDQSLLYVSDTRGQFVYSFQILPDGSLTNKQRFFHLHVVDGSLRSSADGMTVDSKGNLYVATELGVQICDQAGRVQGIIPRPQNRYLSNLEFGGPGQDILFVTCGDKVFKRKTRVHGAPSWSAPVVPARPRL